MASRQDDNYISIRSMSEQLDISFHFLTKVLQQLNSAGLMESHKGPNGGVRLSRPGGEITLFEIVEAIDGTEMFTECAMGLPNCGTGKPCPLHDKWGSTRDKIRNMLETMNLVELARESRELNLRISESGEFDWGEKI